MSRFTRYLYLTMTFLLLLIVLDAGYLTAIWPDWDNYASGPIPKSAFMRDYEKDRAANQNLPAVRWTPIAYKSIPKDMIRAVIVAEDANFFHHEGVDVEALKEAMEYNWEKGRVVYGSSTISQQTVKNLFLSPSRNPVRKLHEYLLTFSMEEHLPKRRIMELYLNVAEFGPGIYGLEAAARHYFGVRASEMTTLQCLELAATLPAPAKNNPLTRTRFFSKRLGKLQNQFGYRPPEATIIETVPAAQPDATETVTVPETAEPTAPASDTVDAPGENPANQD
jgi:monofunctional biosynthetic peptidoglycan transglycosylase